MKTTFFPFLFFLCLWASSVGAGPVAALFWGASAVETTVKCVKKGSTCQKIAIKGYEKSKGVVNTLGYIVVDNLVLLGLLSAGEDADVLD